MQRPQRETVTLEDIVITEQLSQRNPRPANLASENQALHALARQLVNQPQTMLQSLVDMALELCNAQSTGVSLLEVLPSGEEVFRWNVLAGALKQYVGGTTPRNFSPCGTCLDRGTPVLYSYPGRYFTSGQEAITPVVEVLVLPLIAGNQALGAIWIVSHDEQRHFDSEDVRVMTSLADFTAATLLLNQRQTKELLAANAGLEAEIVQRKQAQEQSRALIENLPGGAAFVVDRNLRYLLAEGEALSAAEFKSEDFVGKTIFEVLPPELATYYEVLYRQGLAGEPFELEHDAHNRSYISRGTPLRLPNGEVYAVLAVSYDITERKQAEAALRESEQKYRTLFNSMNEGFCSIEVLYDEGGQPVNHRIKEANSAFEKHTGLKNAPGRLASELMPGVEQYWNDLYGRIVATGESERLEQHSSAFNRWFDVEVSRVGDESLHRVVAVFRDITDRKRAEEALRESEEKYRTLFNSMDEGYFLADVLFDESDQPVDIFYLNANPAATAMVGSDYTGRRLRDIDPHYEEYWYEIFGRVSRTGESVRMEQYAKPDKKWYNFYVFKVSDQESRRVAVIFQNITERKRREANLAFLGEVSQDLARLTNIEETMDALGEKIGKHFNASLCAFSVIGEGAQTMTTAHAWNRAGIPSTIGEHRISDYHIEEFQQACRAGETYVVRDAFNDARMNAANMAVLQAGAFVTVPLVRDGEWRFNLSIADSVPRDWQDDEIELLRELTARIWTQLERARAEEAVHQSEEKFRTFVSAASDIIYEMSADWRKMHFLKGKEFITTTENPRHDWTEEYILETDKPQVWAAINRAIATRSNFELEHRVIRLDGTVGWTFSRAIPLINETGEIVKWFGAASDITEQKQAEVALRESERKLQSAIGVAQLSPYEWNPLTNELKWDARLKAMWGLSADAQINYEIYNAGIYPQDREYVEQQVAKAIDPNGDGIFAAEFRTIGIEDKIERWVSIRGQTFFNAQGLPIHYVGAAQDVTDRKQAEADRMQLLQEQAARDEERQRAEALTQLDRAKTLFFSNVSHEFRTPLTLLLAPLQDALSDRTHPLPQEQRSRLELAQRNAIRLLKLVNTLLDFSRIEAGRMEAVYEPTDLARFTTELASVFRSTIERAGLRLIVDCPPISEPVYVDREMWEKIVLNLLSNAFKFTLEGEIAVRLHLADDHHVTLQVQDTGTGIEPSQLPHLFERFYQVRGTKARTHEGSGIGLALVQELIRLHGGTVDVSSTVGVGSCFTVIIPLGTAHLSSDRLRLDVGDRITATRTQASTALGAAPYVQEAERWIPQESRGRREAGEANSEIISANSEIISANSEIISANSETILANSETISANSETISTNSEIISTNSEIISANSETISANSEIISANSKTISANSKTISANSKTISANSETKTSSPPPSTYVLIVDDNTDMRDYLKRILSEHDVEVEAVADGAAALAAITERVPSLVLSDVMMPQVDGFELLKALRADARTKEVPIILLSARAGEESVIEGLQAGADDYLIKPFSATELVTRVLAHLQMAQLRSQALHQEKTINRMKDKFLAEVSHELNTPLVAILGWTRLLRSSQPSQAMLTKSLETIERNATLQAKLVQDLLDISRITAGKISLNPEPVELQKVIETAIATVQQSLQTKEILLKSTLEPSPVTVEGDLHRLQQIILNLLTNAVKFTFNGGRIEISLTIDENQAQLVITDTGCGIDAEFLPCIFETFSQAPTSKKGLGLGLAIAHSLVELHGGTIVAHSPGVGQGATFTVKLPLMF